MSVDETVGKSRPDKPASDPPTVEPILDDLAAAAEMEAEPEKRRDLTMVRRIAIGAWILLIVGEFLLEGLAVDRTSLIILMCLGLLANCIGRRKMITVIVDWLPFALILILYDLVRNFAQAINMPTHWHLAVDVDHWMFGVNPTVWLQSHLKEPTAPWWEVIVSIVYMSFFIIPYAVAGVLWLRDRTAWRRYAACFVATSFLGLIGYTMVPAAPPWAAAKCTAADVVDYPRDPACMYQEAGPVEGNLLGDVEPTHPGAAPYVERISSRGWNFLGIAMASSLVEVGQGKSNLVAAIPSLHAGLSMLLALFMWPRVKALGKTLFMAYPLAMAFALVYTAEHYVFDILLGWGLAAIVIAAYHVIDRTWLIPRRERHEAERQSDPDDVVVAST
ncbi:phosphoesterase PA-phosphatase related protein [Gordonia bronchialis DSM 43247]|uniref:Phosphoesterase PA-phosphatase related protein n=1 Tax=Gordonia bronchialis (strain ATCC 25592 / DSM 43247 / BCRC 13721 / JCM 3198 / KCTC 3076 / NBRC 16047 / NCTC 10667) TaxID=526226 RepID=D0L6J7_GORB4|nr:phosphatase PAP2 family protein [Gordonia bronchialis]ACY23557.1 phosphoesterase PA-phosphatase related protein [Gordonia bronchialis DSM 43247]MCC3321722.1 phosphatase PAP2 family protein [Gordonia bronchialis]STQ66559.1 PAP2 superfamily [Gordonia bronchialis]